MPPMATRLPSPKHAPDMLRSAARAQTRKPAAQSVYPELDRYGDVQRPGRHGDHRLHDAPQTPLHAASSSQVSAVSGSPSTRPSESPGYSRDTTPTSMSSSPVLASRPRPAVTRPPVTRRRAGSIADASADPHGLASVRESSSSASTIREGARRDRPLSPPPRKSSRRFSRRERLPPEASPGASQKPGAPPPGAPPPGAQPPSPLRPPRPSRDGTLDMALLDPIPVIQSNLSSASRRGSGSSRRGSESSRRGSDARLPGSTSLKNALPEKSSPGSDARSPASPRLAFARFPFFRKKAEPKASGEKPRGPAAGTGHEGYGRVGAVRRRGVADADSFLADRVNPVIIAGGEVVENQNTERRGEGDKGPADKTATADSRVIMESTLAYRRSMQRLRSSDSPLRLPRPIITDAAAPSPVTSFDTSMASEPEPDPHPAPKKLQKASRWNPFTRRKSEKVQATVTAVKKPVPFYAMMDSEQDGPPGTSPDTRPSQRRESLASRSAVPPAPEIPRVRPGSRSQGCRGPSPPDNPRRCISRLSWRGELQHPGGSGVHPSAATAVIPGPGDPPAEDEIWDEYNDLLDDRLPGSTSKTAAGGTHSYADMAERMRANGGEGVGAKRNSSSSCTTCSSASDDALAQVNVRVGSMTVSKWLTFGHVLFSNIRLAASPSILVIDGLGNDDWSFYAAETYPAASVYNLSPRRPAEGAGFPSPANHHQVQYVSHLDAFPFAARSLDCVVYRFPAAAPEAHYGNVVGEARRVLRRGGHMELSILDVDLNNMGNGARRAVRRLKERIHATAAETSLASAADLVVRLLGRAGFSGIKAARVGVPVASSIASSRKHPSLAAMMGDGGAVADEGITTAVARVGRWWYTRCYEGGGDSIWADKALLAECEALGTSLKLMVCCARGD